MQTLDQSLAGLVRMKVITLEEALTHSSHPYRLQKLVQFEYKARMVFRVILNDKVVRNTPE